MASINGVQVKALKTFRGHDGDGYLQGNIYIDGKKAGFWSQDAWCGPDNYDFNTDVLEERAKEYYKANPVVDELKLLGTDDVDFDNLPMTDHSDAYDILAYFMEDLISLAYAEKDYKKHTKGTRWTVMGVLDYYSGRWGIPKDRGSLVFGINK